MNEDESSSSSAEDVTVNTARQITGYCLWMKNESNEMKYQLF